MHVTGMHGPFTRNHQTKRVNNCVTTVYGLWRDTQSEWPRHASVARPLPSSNIRPNAIALYQILAALRLGPGFCVTSLSSGGEARPGN